VCGMECDCSQVQFASMMMKCSGISLLVFKNLLYILKSTELPHHLKG
jgi:hypothetical protein